MASCGSSAEAKTAAKSRQTPATDACCASTNKGGSTATTLKGHLGAPSGEDKTGSTGGSSVTSTNGTGTTPRPATTTTGGGQSVKKIVEGLVESKNGKPIASATVKIVRDAADPAYKASGDNLIARGATDSQGRFSIAVPDVSVGSVLDVTVIKSGYLSVLCYGKYDQNVKEVDFVNFGMKNGDRRLPVDDGGMPPFPFEGLLSNGSAS
jgi:hypothetical protein